MTRRLLTALAVVLVVTPATAAASAQGLEPAVRAGCVGVAHNRSSEFRDADGRPLTSPSVIIVAMTLDGIPAGADAVVQVSLEGRTGRKTGTGQVNDDHQALVPVPIDTFGPYFVGQDAVQATIDGTTVPVDDEQLFDGGGIRVGPEEQPCDLDQLPEGEAVGETEATPPTTGADEVDEPTTPSDETGGGGLDWLWGLLLGGGLIAIVTGLLLRRARDCAELIAACEAARARAAAASAEAAGAEAKAATAAANAATAAGRVAVAQAILEDAERPPDEKSWAESGGKKVTVYDVKLLAKAAAGSWAKYRKGETTAEQCEAEWDHQGTPEALAELKAADKAARAARAAEARAALERAKADADAAKAAADAAAAAAARAGAAAGAARAAADAACAAAAECIGQPLEPGDVGVPPGPGPGPGGDDDGGKTPGPTPGTTPGTTPEPPPAVPGEKVEEEPCRCGPDASTDFLACANWWVGVLRAIKPTALPKLGKSSGYKAGVQSSVEKVAEWLKLVDDTAAYGLLWMLANGMDMDYWPDPVGRCGCPPCDSTVTFLGHCVPKHTFGDWLYGLACGYFGLPDSVQKLGGNFTEVQKMINSDGSIDWKQANAGGGWIRLDPKVSQDLYAEGSKIGKAVRADPNRPVYAGDFGAMVDVADKRPDCPPCPDKVKTFERDVRELAPYFTY